MIARSYSLFVAMALVMPAESPPPLASAPLRAEWIGGEREGDAGDVRWDVDRGPLRLDLGGVDWRGKRTLRFSATSARQTGARIRLEAMGAGEKVIGHVTFAVDWVGEADMKWWLCNFAPEGVQYHTRAPNRDPKRWADVRALRMRCEEPGYWTTSLAIGPPEVSDEAPTWQVNESDTIIDMSWNWMMENVGEWRFVPEESTVSESQFYWRHPNAYGTTFGYKQDERPQRLTLERRFDLDLRDQAQILAKASWDRDTRLTVTAETEGAGTIELIDHGKPASSYLTFGADLDGTTRLRAIRLTLEEAADRKVDGRRLGLKLFWILLRRATALDETPVVTVKARRAGTAEPYPTDVQVVPRRVQQVPPDEQTESATPVGDPLTDGLPFGFYVTRGSLPSMRQRALSGAAKSIFSGIRAEADRALATELVDRNYYGSAYGGGIGHPKGLRGAGMRVFGPKVALAHLVTGEERYAVAARRWVLRAARSDDWRAEHGGCVDRPQLGERLPQWDSFTGWFPRGYSNGHGNHPMQVADAAFGVVVTYELLYHCFGAQERREVEQAFADHGLYMLYDTLYHDREIYVKHNKGLLFALPLLMQTAFLRDRDPVYKGMHEFALDLLRELGTGPWNEEGVCGEGPGYGLGTVGEYLEALPPLAACLGKPVREVMPPGFANLMDYVQHVRSTWWDDRPRFLGFSDGSEGNWVPGEVFAFFANYARDPVAQYFWNESYAENPPDNLTTFLMLGDRVAPAEPDLPPAKVFRDQPMAFLRTGWKHGDTLLAMTNLRYSTGHGHFDRGHFILEYGGEQLLLDPGMISYGAANRSEYEATCCHNTLTFSQRNQQGRLEVFDTAIAGFLSTSGDHCPGLAGGIDWVCADTTAVYPEAARAVRHFVFLRPDVFLVCDEVRAKRPEKMELNFTCLGPLSLRGDLFVSTATKNRLTIHSQATTTLEHQFKDWGTHWKHIPSYRLIRGTTKPVDRCTFLTVLAPHSKETVGPTIEPVEVTGGLGVRVRHADSEELFLCGAAQERLSTAGIDTDARMAAVRMKDGRISGAAMFDGTDLRIVGKTVLSGGDGRLTGFRATSDGVEP